MLDPQRRAGRGLPQWGQRGSRCGWRGSITRSAQDTWGLRTGEMSGGPLVSRPGASEVSAGVTEQR